MTTDIEPARPSPAYMIDGPSTVDRDDAIRLETDEDGTRTLTVYIADLTAAVDADPTLLGAALERGATIYRRQIAIDPMLPGEVEAAHALVGNAARPALIVSVAFDADAVPGPAEVTRGELPGGVALTYEQAATAVLNRADSHHRNLALLRALAEQLFRRRYGASSAFYDLAHGVFVNEDGVLVKVRISHAIGHLIVQECMIAANQAIAEWAVERDVPIVFRNHMAAATAPPAAVHLADLSVALRSEDPNELALWLTRAEQTGRRARYDAYPRGHHGLDVPVYTHATSPLRRAADLLTQRAIVAHLEGRPAPCTAEELAGMCERLTVVTAENAAASSEARRERAHALARAILEQDTDYHALSPGKFFDLVKRATKEGIASVRFLAEVERRAAGGRLGLRDLYHLLLLPTGEEWAGAKKACLAQVAGSPHDAVSLVAMYAQARGAAPVYQQMPTGTLRTPRFTVVGSLADAAGSRARGAARTGPNKAGAQAQAALSLLAALVGASDPSSDLEAKAPARAVAAPRPAKAPDLAEAPAPQPSFSGSAAEIVNRACQTRALTDVAWTWGTSVQDERLMFEACVTAYASGTALEAHGKAAAKKLAKARAVQALAEQLKAHRSSQHPDSVEPADAGADDQETGVPAAEMRSR